VDYSDQHLVAAGTQGIVRWGRNTLTTAAARRKGI
jgi:hypothetical protein